MFAALIPVLGTIASSIAGSLFPDPAQETERKKVEAAVQQGLMNQAGDLIQAMTGIVRAEVDGKGIKSWWRPITMMTFLVMLVSWWFGYTPDRVTPDLMDKLFDLLQIGIGGYIGGRTLEKTVPSVLAALKAGKG